MKRYLLLFIAVFFGILMALPQTAEARHRRKGYVRVYTNGYYGHYRPYRQRYYRTYYRPYYRSYYRSYDPYYSYYPYRYYRRPGVSFSVGF